MDLEAASIGPERIQYHPAVHSAWQRGPIQCQTLRGADWRDPFTGRDQRVDLAPGSVLILDNSVGYAWAASRPDGIGGRQAIIGQGRPLWQLPALLSRHPGTPRQPEQST